MSFKVIQSGKKGGLTIQITYLTLLTELIKSIICCSKHSGLINVLINQVHSAILNSGHQIVMSIVMLSILSRENVSLPNSLFSILLNTYTPIYSIESILSETTKHMLIKRFYSCCCVCCLFSTITSNTSLLNFASHFHECSRETSYKNRFYTVLITKSPRSSFTKNIINKVSILS